MYESSEPHAAGVTTESVVMGTLPLDGQSEAQRKLPAYELRQAILAWRDTQMEGIDRHLRDRVKELHASIAFACKDMPVQREREFIPTHSAGAVCALG